MIAGAAFIGLGAVAVKMAGDFQQSMTQLVTGAGESRSNLKAVSDGILQMSVDTATGTDKLAAGMFNVESASYHLANGGLLVLKAAAEGAKAENADLAQTTDVLTTTMHGLHASASLAVPIMNSLIATERDGKMRMDDLTGSMRTVLPVSSALHIKLSDVEGALATMAASGDKGASAGTHLAMMFKMLENPASTASKEMKAMGIDSVKLAETMSTSLPAALQMIQDAVAQHFTPGSVEYERAIAKILGGSKSGIAGLELLGGNFKNLAKNTNDAAEALRKGGVDVENWDLIQKNFNFQLDAAKNAVEALFIKVGTSLLPALTQLLQTVTPLITSFTNWATSGHALNDVINAFNANTQTLVPILSGLAAVLMAALIPATVTLAGSVIAATWPFLALGVAVGGLVALFLRFHPEITTVSGAFQTMWPIIQNTGIALAVFFTPSLIKAGVEAVVSAAKITYNFVASMILTGSEGWAAAGKLAVFIASLIATGAQAVWNAAKVTYSFIASLIATASEAYAAAFAVTGSFVPALGLVGIQAVSAGGKLAVNFVQGLVAARTASVATAATISTTATPAIAGAGTAATVAAGPIIALGAIFAATAILIANKAYIMDKNVQTDTGEMVTAQQLRFHQMASGANISATEMKNGVSNSANDMKNNVVQSFSNMAQQTYSDTSTLSQNALQNFQNLNGDLTSQMATIDANVIGYWNDIANWIASHEIVGHVTYTTAGGDIGVQQSPTTGHNAGGTDNWRGGWSWVGEKGPELMNIPRGAQIIPHDRSIAASSGGGQPVQININIAGNRVAQTLLPDIVQAVRSHTGVRF